MTKDSPTPISARNKTLVTDLIWVFAGAAFMLILPLAFHADIFFGVSGAGLFLVVGLLISLNRWYAARERER